MADSSPAPQQPPSASTPSPVPPPLQTLQQLPTQTELQKPSVGPSLIKAEKPGPTAATPELSTTDTPEIPTAASTVSYTIIIPSCSAWFSWDEIHDTERRLLPEFFDGKSTSRNLTSYKYLRDAIISRFRSQPTRKLTYTEARRGLVGDVGSVRKVFDFLEEWGLINYTPPPKKGKEEPEARGGERKEGSYGKRTCTSCGALCSLQCFTTAKANMTLCAKCFVKSNYQRPGLSSADFKRVDLLEDPRPDWTDKETLHLLEAILHSGEDWKKVAEYVASRPAKECIARFVKLSFGEQFIGPKEEHNGFPEHDGDEADESESVKRRRLSPLVDASNPIMAQVAFLSAIVGPHVAENAAQAAISALSNLDANEATDVTEPSDTETKEASAVNDPIATAQVEIEKEQQDLEQSISDIIEVQMKEMQEKIVRFEEMESIMERERLQVQYLKDLLLADQLAVAQHQHRGAMMARDNVNTWEKLRSINEVIDRGTTILL
ncbi:SWI/SNF complex subunit SWI3B [Carex littledalei]|uniref:SWI/SNF complex subunit SWI3B n=1 Tax=Carex littledalei TaxID=544730 RepID=A0A833QMW9_9POAL|nr:SWI/SNF complex subunit SWI3B [Carex littledalei]